jgi:rubrerythrin
MAKDWLKSLIGDEQEAQSHYVEAADDAREDGEDELARLFEHINEQEVHHEKELRDQIGGKKSEGFIRESENA